jgi:hypothetical protein
VISSQLLLVEGCSGQGQFSGLLEEVDAVFVGFFGLLFSVMDHSWRIKLDVSGKHSFFSIDQKEGGEADIAIRSCAQAQSTEGSSSTQQPAELSRGSTNLGLMPARTKPFAFSTCLLDCGCATEARSSRMPFWLQKSAKTPFVKFVPLSVMMLCGRPYLTMISLKNLMVEEPSVS